jgi:hypothetical protein
MNRIRHSMPLQDFIRDGGSRYQLHAFDRKACR